jgi:hypothetical protein
MLLTHGQSVDENINIFSLLEPFCLRDEFTATIFFVGIPFRTRKMIGSVLFIGGELQVLTHE